MPRLLILVLVLTIAGCAGPSLKQKDISKDAVRNEAFIQKRLAKEDFNKQKERLYRVSKKISPQVRKLCSYLSDEKKSNCYFPVELIDSNEVNAQTDGKKVTFFKGIMKVLETDEDIAVVLGHEYAHAMLLHMNKRKSNMYIGLLFDVLVLGATGVDTQGAFSKVGAKVYSKDFEFEADYAGLYLAYLSGYDISESANVWRKMAIENQSSIVESFNSTHPSSSKRFLALEKTYEEITLKVASGEVLLPDKLQAIETEDVDKGKLMSEVVNQEYTSITRPVKKKPAQIALGDFVYKAKKEAENVNCSEQPVFKGLVKEEYGVELYEFDCLGNLILVQCDLGNCKEI